MCDREIREEKMKKLLEELIAIEEERLAGGRVYTLEEVEASLDRILSSDSDE